MVHNVLHLLPFLPTTSVIFIYFFPKFVFFFSTDCRNAEVESPVYMELERETPLQEGNAADAELNPVYDRFVCLFLVTVELFYYNPLFSAAGTHNVFFVPYSRLLMSIIGAFISNHTRPYPVSVINLIFRIKQ